MMATMQLMCIRKIYMREHMSTHTYVHACCRATFVYTRWQHLALSPLWSLGNPPQDCFWQWRNFGHLLLATGHLEVSSCTWWSPPSLGKAEWACDFESKADGVRGAALRKIHDSLKAASWINSRLRRLLFLHESLVNMVPIKIISFTQRAGWIPAFCISWSGGTECRYSACSLSKVWCNESQRAVWLYVLSQTITSMVSSRLLN